MVAEIVGHRPVIALPEQQGLRVVAKSPEASEIKRIRPSRGYATVEFTPEGYNLAVLNNARSVRGTFDGPVQEVPQALQRLAREAGISKVVAAAVVRDRHEDPDQDYQEKTAAIKAFNDQHDIAPIFLSKAQMMVHGDEQIEDPLIATSRWVSKKFNTYGSEKVEPDHQTRRVHALETVTLEASRKQYPQKFWQESMAIINKSAEELDNSIIVRINTTARAGGVAGMNHPMDAWIKAYNENEERKLKKGEEGHPIDFRWYVLDGYVDPKIAEEFGVDLKDSELLARYGDPDDPDKGPDIFKLTKKRHNLAQNVAKPHEDYDDLDEKFYQAWGKSQYEHKLKELVQLLQDSKDNSQAKKLKIIVDDQQPAVLSKYIQAENPDAVQIFRSHIQYTDGAKAKNVADHLIKDLTDSEGRSRVAAFVSHRSRDEQMDEFLPKGADGQVDARVADITMYKVATADQLGELERHMDGELARPYWQDINVYLQKTGQKTISEDDVKVGFVGQFARHDPAKNHDGAVEAAFMRMERMLEAGVPLDKIPGQIIAGYGAADDPDGEWVEAKIRTLVKEKHIQLEAGDKKALIDKIKVFRLDYKEYSGHHMNVLQRVCVLGEQLSLAEGCEDKITQLLQMNIPVLVADVGGMPPQIVDGKTGVKIKDPRDLEDIANVQYQLLYGQYLADEYRNSHPEEPVVPTPLEQMRENTKTMVNLEYTTLANIRDIVGLSALLNNRDQIPAMVREQREAKGDQFPFVKDLVEKKYAKDMKVYIHPQEHVVFAYNGLLV